MPVIKIRSRLAPATPANATATTGKPVTLAGGELAYNSAGLNLIDKQNGGALYIGDGKKVVTLISSDRQVERIGNQTIQGVKTFVDSIRLGGAGYSLPNANGNAADFLRMNSAGTDLEWAPEIQVAVRNQLVFGTTGSVEGNLNADSTGLTVGSNELIIIQDNETKKNYIWLGGTGKFGTAAGGTPITSAMVAVVGNMLNYATAADLQSGTDPQKVIAANVAKQEVFLKSTAAGNQEVMVPVTTFKGKVPGDGNGQVMFLGDLIMGDPMNPITITAQGGCTLKGQVSNKLIIDHAVLDGGDY